MICRQETSTAKPKPVLSVFWRSRQSSRVEYYCKPEEGPRSQPTILELINQFSAPARRVWKDDALKHREDWCWSREPEARSSEKVSKKTQGKGEEHPQQHSPTRCRNPQRKSEFCVLHREHVVAYPPRSFGRPCQRSRKGHRTCLPTRHQMTGKRLSLLGGNMGPGPYCSAFP